MTKLFLGVLFAMYGIINAKYMSARFSNAATAEDRANTNAWLLMKMFDYGWSEFWDFRGASLFCEKFDSQPERCLKNVFVILCHNHGECSQFLGDLESIDKYTMDVCGKNPDDVIECMTDNVDQCGNYFDDGNSCSDVINNYISWIKSKFMEKRRMETDLEGRLRSILKSKGLK